MKHLIPCAFAISGAYLIGLPLYSQITAVNIITKMINPANGAGFSTFPFAPYMHLFIPWVAGAILIFMAIFIALKTIRD